MNTKNFSLSTKMGSSGAWKSYSRYLDDLELKFKPLKVPKDKGRGRGGFLHYFKTPHYLQNGESFGKRIGTLKVFCWREPRAT